MAGYQQIQTYMTTMEAKHFVNVLQTCKQLLQKTSWLTANVEAWIENIEWSMDDKGLLFIDSPVCSPTFEIGKENGKIKAGLDILQWGQSSGCHITESWIEISFYFNSGVSDEEFFMQYGSEIEKMMMLLSHLFQETGVYLTNVLQDGEPFEGIIKNNNGKFWDFYSAIIPNSLISQYPQIPVHFDTREFSHGIRITRKSAS